MSNFVLWGTKKGQPDFAECIIDETQNIDKLQQLKVWAVKHGYKNLRVETYNDNYNTRSDDLKIIRI